jgi:hypothetical protein
MNLRVEPDGREIELMTGAASSLAGEARKILVE